MDRAGWHVAKALVVPEGIHLVHPPASTRELQPAGQLWPPLREAVANERFADLAALDVRLSAQCPFIAASTCYHWWPQI